MLRTLHVSLGPRGWALYLYRAGRLDRVIVDSRVPVEVAKNNTRIAENLEELSSLLEGLASKGVPVYRFTGRSSGEGFSPEKRSAAIVLDYTGSLPGRDTIVRGYPGAYDAALAVYLYSRTIRERPWGLEGAARIRDPRLYLAIARRLAESLHVFDNYVLVEPNTFAYMLSKALRGRGLFAEPLETRTSISHSGGGRVQVVRIRVYRLRGLRPVGDAVVELAGGRVVVSLPGGEEYIYYFDSSCGRILLYDGTPVEPHHGLRGEG